MNGEWHFNELTGTVFKKYPLENGYEVSVVKGFGTYSSRGTYEVAVITPEGKILEPERYVSPKRLQEIMAETEKIPHNNENGDDRDS